SAGPAWATTRASPPPRNSTPAAWPVSSSTSTRPQPVGRTWRTHEQHVDGRRPHGLAGAPCVGAEHPDSLGLSRTIRDQPDGASGAALSTRLAGVPFAAAILGVRDQPRSFLRVAVRI